MKSKKVRGDKLVLALISAFRTLVGELSKKGIIDPDEFVALLRGHHEYVISAHLLAHLGPRGFGRSVRGGGRTLDVTEFAGRGARGMVVPQA